MESTKTQPLKTAIEELAAKAAKESTAPHEAMQFAQAALNLAHAATLHNALIKSGAWAERSPAEIQARIDAAVLTERERCAKLCEDKGPELLRWWGDGQANAACQECATAIRGPNVAIKLVP